MFAVKIYGMTLERKYSKKITILVWFLIAAVLTVVGQYTALAQHTLYAQYEEFFATHGYIINSIVNLQLASFILQVLLMLAGANILYADKGRMKIFVSFMCYMYFSLAYDFLIPIVMAVCSGGVDSEGMFLLYTEKNYFVCYAVDIMATCVFGSLLYILYQKKLHSYFCEIRKVAALNGKAFVAIPVITYFLYSIYISYTVNLELDYSYENDFYHFIMLMGIMLSMMLLMYIFAFYGMMMMLQNANIEAELSVAAKIQLDALPDIIEEERFQLAAMMEPAKAIGGDFYDFFMIDDNHLALGISDVSGKGVSAALFMMESKAAIKSCAMWDAGTAIALTNANLQLCENNKEKMFVTSFLAIFDLETKELSFANAGHNYPLLYHDGKWDWLKTKPKLFLAARKKIRYEETTMQLSSGDMLLLYTDGLTEAMDPDNQQYGNDRLEHFLNSHENHDVKQLIDMLYQDVKDFVRDAEPSDDLTMLLMKVV
ncbi:MAG: PP2C family protein-serine/threonine phosphatase [bacterium]|nr:PP2C family protein-serine/threonine phosphatase [bacterium]